MIVSITFKTPDVLEQINEYAPHKNYGHSALTKEEYEWIRSHIKWGEYITVLFDVEKRTIEIAKP